MIAEMKVDTKKIKSLTSFVKKILDESTFEIVPQGHDSPPMGMENGGMLVSDDDSATVAFVHIMLSSDHCDEFNASRLLEAGVIWERMDEAIGNVETDKTIISINEDLRMEIKDTEDDFRAVMSLIDSASLESQSYPDVDWNLNESTTVSRLQAGINGAKWASDNVEIVIEDGEMIARGEGDTSDSQKKICDISYDDGEFTSMYNSNYLNKILDSLEDDRVVDVVMRNGDRPFPIRICGEISGIEGEFMVAPRVEKEV